MNGYMTCFGEMLIQYILAVMVAKRPRVKNGKVVFWEPTTNINHIWSQSFYSKSAHGSMVSS